MSKLTWLGLLSWLGSLLLLGFQGISALTHTQGEWDNLSIEDVMEPGTFVWIDDLTVTFVKDAADYLVTMPMYILLFAAGFLFFLINAFTRKL